MLLGRCSRQLRKSGAGENIVYSRAELDFFYRKITSHRNRLLLSVKHLAVHILNKTAHRLEQHFERHEVFVCDRCSSSDKTAELTTVQIQSNSSPAKTGCGSENLTFPLVSSFCA
jgi:hypothetical protein